LCTLGNRIIQDPVITVLVVLGAQYFCFNLFHLDGLLDTADAFLGSVSEEKRLAILKDSRIGVYGFFAGFLTLALKTALLVKLQPFIPIYGMAILAYPLGGRFCAASVPTLTESQNDTGLGALAGHSTTKWVVVGTLIAAAAWVGINYGLTRLEEQLTPSPVQFQESMPPLRFLPPDRPFRRNTIAYEIPGYDVQGYEIQAYEIPRYDVPSYEVPSENPQPLTPDAKRTLVINLFGLAGLLCCCFFVSLALARLYHKGIGGYTGDALGAAVELGELLYLGLAFLLFHLVV
jgi:adenosylcobinamide-GDP ribazoletransferase